MYKMYVEMADRSSSRRVTSNGFFVTLNSASAAWLSFLTAHTDRVRLGLVAAAVVGLLLSAAWFMTIRSFARLSTAKFEVVQRMEAQLASAPFTDEWNAVRSSSPATGPAGGAAAGAAGRTRRPLPTTVFEQAVPVIFGIYAVVVLVAAW